MKKLIFRLSIILVIFLLLTLNMAWGQTDEVLASYAPTAYTNIQVKTLDPKAEVLEDYLAKHNSPLKDHAQDFIDAANLYNLDWRLVAAISGTESTFGKHIPGGYNGWGWGVYGNQALGFKSWKDGIFTVSKGLRENYVNRGYTEPYSMNRIYAASPTWGAHVTFFMKDMEKFASRYDKSEVVINMPVFKIAANSGLLGSN